MSSETRTQVGIIHTGPGGGPGQPIVGFVDAAHAQAYIDAAPWPSSQYQIVTREVITTDWKPVADTPGKCFVPEPPARDQYIFPGAHNA